MRDANRTFIEHNMADLKFKIKTEADLKALKETKTGLEEAAKATKALGQNTDQLEKEIKQVDDALNSEAASAVKAAEGFKKAIAATKQAGGDASGLKRQLGAVRNQYDLPGRNPLSKAAGFITESAGKLPGAGTFQTIFNGSSSTVAGAGAALATAAKSISEFAGAEERVASLDAALAQSGQLTDAYREKLQALAGDFQKVTGVADDQWIEVLSRLTQFGSKPETIGIDLEAVKNLAGIMKGDIIGAAEAYSRALQGNYEIFSRYGIQVEAAGTQLEKLAKLQEQLAERGGGQLEARNRTLIGQWGQLKNNVSDLFEAIGRGIAKTGALQAVLYGLASSAGWLAEKLGGIVPQVEGLRNVSQGMATAADSAAAAMDAQATAADRLAENTKKAADAIAEQRRESEALKLHQDKLDDLDMAAELEKLQGSKLSNADKITEEKRIRSKYAEQKRQREKGLLVGDMENTADRAVEAQTLHDGLQKSIHEQENRTAKAEQRQQLIDDRKAALESAKKMGASASDLEQTAEIQKAFKTPEYWKTVKDVEHTKHQEKKALELAENLKQQIDQTPDVGSVEENRKRLADLRATGAVKFPEYEQTMESAPKEIQQREKEIERMDQIHERERANERLQKLNATQKAQTSAIEQDAASAGPVSDREAALNMQIAENNLKVAQKLDEARVAQGAAMERLLSAAENLEKQNSDLLRRVNALSGNQKNSQSQILNNRP
jgi:hypothetical protein